jgi:hypothetical protein
MCKPAHADPRAPALRSFLILAAHLLHRAQDILHRSPEASAFTYRKPRTSSPPCVRRDHPLAYAEMMDGVRNLLNSLPNAYKINVLDSTPWSHPDVPTIVSKRQRSSTSSSRNPLSDVRGSTS